MQAPQAGQVRLVPTLPSSNPRYDQTLAIPQARSFSIPRQSFIVKNLHDTKQPPNPLSSAQSFVHPEGDVYYYDGSRRILTTSDPGLSPWSRAFEAAYQQIIQLLGGPTRLPLSSELWLSSQPTGSFDVGYYIVDHDKRVIYWLEDADVRGLGLGPFESNVDLRGVLTSEYWVHVDYYPSHRDLDTQAENDLTATLRHGCIDDMTAPGSTFPWGAEECRQFLNVLEGFRTETSDDVAERMSCIARLWAAIYRVRHINGYGTSNARLDRFQGLEGYLNHQTVPSLFLTLGEAATLGHSWQLFRRMTELWNGRVVYQRHWKSFLDDMRREWTQMTYFPLAIWMACIILVASDKACTVVFVSAWLAAAAFLVSLYLLQAHSEDKLSTAPGISSWISRVEDVKHGLRPLSITFALPRALTMYAFVSLQLGLVLVYNTSR